MTEIKSEIKSGDRFKFGQNWNKFATNISDEQIEAAEKALTSMLNVERLDGLQFLDAGSGSGLSSLAARRLGAEVVSFDFDPESVACTQKIKKRYFDGDASWIVQTGSVLDSDFLMSLGTFDIVYSWGVLHHTGNMHLALRNMAALVKPNGSLFISIYNDQGIFSKIWCFIKHRYNKHPILRPLLIMIYLIFPVIPSMIIKMVLGRSLPRGMSYWNDALDWLGGYPFEVAKPEEIFDIYNELCFVLDNFRGVGIKSGCNEFVFKKIKSNI